MSIHEIRVFEEFSDPRGHEIERMAAHDGDNVAVQTNRIYYVEGVSDNDADLLAGTLLTDPNTQSYVVGRRSDWADQRKIDVSPLPGATNTEMGSVEYGSSLLGVEIEAVESGTDHIFAPSVTLPEVEHVVERSLVNKTIQQIRTESPSTLKIEGTGGHIESVPIRGLDNDALLAISKDRSLALNVSEMRSAQEEADRMARDTTDGELEYLGAGWSEHCCHKTTNAEILRNGELVASVFGRIKEMSMPYMEERGVLSYYGDNSGVVRFYDGMAFNIKLETHNSPRMVEPKGGAATGTGGVLRDINETGLGARPINSMHMDFIAPPDMDTADIPPNTLSPAQLLRGSIRGVGGYGNPMGVPTNNGSLHIHPNYRGKASILVGSMGIMHEKDAAKGEPRPGDLVVAVGGRTGKDGIHGATFSSESADHTTSTVHSGAVQNGDPITEKKMFDAILEAGQRGLIRAMTDCGAAGFASAIGELGEDIGVDVDMARAPLKYTGLQPWEIFLSESQERGVLAVDPENIGELQAIFEKHISEATVLGTFGTPDDEPRLQVRYGDQMLVDLRYEFIKNGRENLQLTADWQPPSIDEKKATPKDWVTTVKTVLRDWNVCSKEPIVRRYDHEVQGTSAMKSYDGVHGDAPNNAAVMTPILGEPHALIQAHGCNPALTDLDPTNGSKWSYVEGMSNYVAVGGNPDDAVIVNNYISATPTDHVMGALDKSVDALAECVHEFRSPVISGKDSLSSTYKYPDGSVLESPYNLIITVAGKIPDVERTVSSDIKQPGSTLVMIGKQDKAAFGGSVYYDNFEGQSAHVPEIDLTSFHHTATTLHEAIKAGDVLSAHDVSEGGLAVTISEMLFGGDCGAAIDLSDMGDTVENAFFNETAGCFVVEVASPEDAQRLFGSTPHKVIGQTTYDKELSVTFENTEMPRLSVAELKAEWKRPLKELLS